MTALGDMAWYSMRAMVEYLRPQGRITKVVTIAERDPGTTAIMRASGLIAFDGGEVSTFDIGYTAATIIMDLQLLGTNGVIGNYACSRSSSEARSEICYAWSVHGTRSDS
jgi:hypothetical protein